MKKFGIEKTSGRFVHRSVARQKTRQKHAGGHRWPVPVIFHFSFALLSLGPNRIGAAWANERKESFRGTANRVT